MSNKNYTNYSKPNKAKEVFETPVEDTVVETPIDETVVETPVEESVEEEVVENPIQLGVVVNCIKLRVRAEANTNADILDEIDALSEVHVELSESTDYFYKVCTAAGLEGYCMKKFIVLK